MPPLLSTRVCVLMWPCMALMLDSRGHTEFGNRTGLALTRLRAGPRIVTNGRLIACGVASAGHFSSPETGLLRNCQPASPAFTSVPKATWKPLWPATAIGLIVLAAALATLYMTKMAGHSYKGPFEPLSEHELAIRGQLKSYVVLLAGTIGERNMVRYQALTASANYISQTFQGMGYTVREQVFPVEGKEVRNLEAELRGTSWRPCWCLPGSPNSSASRAPCVSSPS
jgi:hypothetical protein